MDERIIVDSREQRPLFKGVTRKLDEGDYNTENLLPHIVIERKSPSDLYGSIVQGHNRFVDEIIRSKLKGKKFYLVVECTEKDFYGKNWSGSQYSRLPSKTTAKIISTMVERYGVMIVWCEGRIDARRKIKEIIRINNIYYNIYKQ